MINSLQRASSDFTAAPAATSPGDRLSADKDTFLKLLVAQLQNQDPLQPQDGIEFVTQLAQFTELENSTTIREDLARVRELLEAAEGTTATYQTNP